MPQLKGSQTNQQRNISSWRELRKQWDREWEGGKEKEVSFNSVLFEKKD